VPGFSRRAIAGLQRRASNGFWVLKLGLERSNDVARLMPRGKTHKRRKEMAAKKPKKTTKRLKKLGKAKKLEATKPLASDAYLMIHSR
jgi:hypothetical protein